MTKTGKRDLLGDLPTIGPLANLDPPDYPDLILFDILYCLVRSMCPWTSVILGGNTETAVPSASFLLSHPYNFWNGA